VPDFPQIECITVLADKELFVKEGTRIVNEAARKGVTIRFMGAAAIEKHCSAKKSQSIGRLASTRRLSDLDFIAYSAQWHAVTKLFELLGYRLDPTHTLLHGQERLLLRNPENSLIPHVDVFFDKLSFCHTIDFKKQKRLEVDSPTISLADLLLEKMQIAQINEKDVIDTIVMLAEHDIGPTDSDTINSKYIAQLLADDWGFYYTVTTNLKRIRDSYMQTYDVLTSSDKDLIGARIESLLTQIENQPKSLGWQIRSKIGTSKKWYNDVEEVVR
jgi:hypothetical protein